MPDRRQAQERNTNNSSNDNSNKTTSAAQRTRETPRMADTVDHRATGLSGHDELICWLDDYYNQAEELEEGDIQ